ncbi:MAG: hypothetical protein LQ347_002032 [Umbilicaria vellea]|nr:MAG: hypothetical protein LQ347_002032 [Umbilicaria vellea]
MPAQLPRLSTNSLPPPPPYSPHDILTPASSSSSNAPTHPDVAEPPVITAPRGGYMSPVVGTEEESYPSAAAYFEDRPCSFPYPGNVLHYHLVTSPAISPEDLSYPQPDSHYRVRDVSCQDWATFVNHVLSHNLGTGQRNAKTAHEEKGRAKRQDTPERRRMIEATVAEWNEGFFGPRGIRIHAELPDVSEATLVAAPSYSGEPNPRVSYRESTPSAPFVASQPICAPREPLSAQPPAPYGRFPFQWAHGLSGQAHAYTDRLHTHKGEHTAHHHRRRRSVSSTSSSSSSSSSSSDSSVDSISSRDISGADPSGIRQTLAAFRLSPTRHNDLSSSVRHLRDTLRSQRPGRGGRPPVSRELKAELHNSKREIKAEIVALVRQVRSSKREARAMRREGKREQKRERKADRSARRCEKRDRRAERRTEIGEERQGGRCGGRNRARCGGRSGGRGTREMGMVDTQDGPGGRQAWRGATAESLGTVVGQETGVLTRDG